MQKYFPGKVANRAFSTRIRAGTAHDGDRNGCWGSDKVRTGVIGTGNDKTTGSVQHRH